MKHDAGMAATPHHAFDDEPGGSNCGAADPLNRCEQRRDSASSGFTAFDSLLSSSLQEMYSKGMILASGIKQVRGLGDNKFEVVTSLRTFVFRAEREGRASR